MRRLPGIIVALAAVLFAPVSLANPLAEFEEAMLAGEYARAIEIGEGLARQHPQSTVVAFNVACAMSRAGRIEEGLDWLEKSADLGFGGVRSVEDEADLENLRASPRFAGILGKVRATARARFERFREEAEKHEPAVRLPRRHDAREPAPLIIALHGTGGNGERMAGALARPAARIGAIVVAPDALRPAQAGGYSWTYRDESEWFVLRTIEKAREKWAIGPVILVGFSQGANIALMVGQSHPEAFDAVIPIAGHYESDVAELPSGDDLPRWRLIIGERDGWAYTYEDAERDFEGAGMTVERDVVRGMGHQMPGERVLTEALEWAVGEGA